MPRFILIRRSFNTLHPVQKWWSMGLMITILFPLLTWGLNETIATVPETFRDVHSTITTVLIVIYLTLTAPAQALSFPLSYGLSQLAVIMNNVRDLLVNKGFGDAVTAFEQHGTLSDASSFLFNGTLLQPESASFPTLNLILQWGFALFLNSLFFAGIGWCFTQRPAKKWAGLAVLTAAYLISLYFTISFFAENEASWGYSPL